MHIEYWVCDYCKKEIEHDEHKKYATPEMGYPFIPKSGGGKHFHLACLINYYKKKKLSQEEIAELVDDAERRHYSHISKNLKKGNLTKDKLDTRRATKKDREELMNYFYDYYGLRGVTKTLNLMVDSLNSGKDCGDIHNVKIPYYQLKDMLVYYRTELDKMYSSKNKSGKFISPVNRIYYDIIVVVNNIDDYATRRSVVYNLLQNNQVDGGGKLEDLSIYLNYNAPRKNTKDKKKMEEIDKMVDEWVNMKDDN